MSDNLIPLLRSIYSEIPHPALLAAIGRLERLERERNDLAEALREMRYGHTDKAERMAVSALKYSDNACLSHGDDSATPPPPTSNQSKCKPR